MNILAVTNMYPTDGNRALGTFVEQQVLGLREAGVDVDVLYLNRRQDGPATYLTAVRRVQAAIKRFNPDIVHIMYGGVMADLATRAVRDRPTVVTFHGSDLLGGQMSGPVRRLIARYGVVCSRRSAERATGVVVVARVLWDALPATVDRSKVRIIPCGIDMTRFKPLDRGACRRELSWPDDDFNVLFNSNGDDPVKQPALARSAIEALRRTGIRAHLHELRGLSNREMPKRLNAGDVLLLTSRHEGSPTIVKEALACDTPVVSVDVGDVREQISGIAGCYLSAPDPEEIAAKLRLVHDGPRRVEAHHRIAELSIGAIALRLKQFYEQLQHAHRHRPHLAHDGQTATVGR